MPGIDVAHLASRVGIQVYKKVSDSNGISIWDVELGGLFRRFHEPAKLVWLEASRGLEEQELGDVLRHVGQRNVSARRFAVVLTESESHSARLPALPETWAVLDKAAIEAIVSAGRPKAALSKAIRERVPLSHLSPYSTAETVPPSMFVGRDAERREMRRNPQDNFVLIGPRRIGKSSFVKMVERDIRGETGPGVRLAADRYALNTAYVDCNLLPNLATPDDDFFTEALKAMNVQQRDVAYSRKVFGRKVRDATPFEYYYRLVSSKFSSATLIIDEIDGLIERDRQNSWAFLRKAQGLVDQRGSGLDAGQRCHINVILVGFTALHDSLSDTSFPFYGRCRELVLSNLGRQETEKLVVPPLRELGIRVEPDDEVVNRVLEQTGGMPSLVQSVCRETVRRVDDTGNRLVTPDMIDNVVRTLAPVDDYMNWVDFRATRLERSLVYFAAPLSRLRSVDAIDLFKQRGIHGVTVNTLRPALDRLALANILRAVRRHDTYEFSVEAFRRAIMARPERAATLDELVQGIRNELNPRKR